MCPRFENIDEATRAVRPRSSQGALEGPTIVEGARDDEEGKSNDDAADDVVEDAIDFNQDEEPVGERYRWQNEPISARAVRVVRTKNIEISNLPQFKKAATVGISSDLKRKLRGKEPNEFLEVFFDDSIMESFISATNWYGTTYVDHWEEDVTSTELSAFFALILTQGLIKYPTRSMAFNDTLFSAPIMNTLMLETRFSHILRAWHFVNLEGKTCAEVRAIKQTDLF